MNYVITNILPHIFLSCDDRWSEIFFIVVVALLSEMNWVIVMVVTANSQYVPSLNWKKRTAMHNFCKRHLTNQANNSFFKLFLLHNSIRLIFKFSIQRWSQDRCLLSFLFFLAHLLSVPLFNPFLLYIIQNFLIENDFEWTFCSMHYNSTESVNSIFRNTS